MWSGGVVATSLRNRVYRDAELLWNTPFRSGGCHVQSILEFERESTDKPPFQWWVADEYNDGLMYV